jgi:CMP-N-acetylneuraminate monooxygenase
MEYKIGSTDILEKLPIAIKIDGRPYILSRKNNSLPILFSAICPHQSGIVSELKKEMIRCPNHGWEYDSHNGKAMNVPDKCLQSYQVKIENDFLYVDLPLIKIKKQIFGNGLKIPPKITIVGAAGLLFEWNGLNILSDPWIEGPCMLGGWTNYPPPGMKVKDLPKIDIIWISHEHSDHYHEPTLSQLEKNIPVYVTKFDDGRLAKRLQKLGFTKVIQIKTGEPIKITKEIELISFKSGSIWNDSISYWKFGNFTILNCNDAGFNWKIKDMIGEVDLVCQQFTGPTSSYPVTWNHLDNKQKNDILIRQNIGMLKMMENVADVCNAKYVLPFANFFELGNPEHLKYMKIQRKNTLETVVKFFKNKKIKVLDLIPGESWDGASGKINRNPERERFFDENFMFKYLQDTNEFEKRLGCKSTKFDMGHDEIKKYFELFSGSKLAKDVGTYSVSFTIESEKSFHGLISFKNGNVDYEQTPSLRDADMQMSCPGGIVQEVIKRDLSWDEAFNGFWCTFSRKPDVYNIHFWKLLYAPWRARPDYIEQRDLEFTKVNTDMSIADIIEKGGLTAAKIFEKYGLFCSGCEPGIGESVEEGCKLHGISDKKTRELIDELNLLEI